MHGSNTILSQCIVDKVCIVNKCYKRVKNSHVEDRVYMTDLTTTKKDIVVPRWRNICPMVKVAREKGDNVNYTKKLLIWEYFPVVIIRLMYGPQDLFLAKSGYLPI